MRPAGRRARMVAGIARMKPRILLSILIFSLCCIAKGGEAMALEMESASFANGKFIPAKYTGEGEDISPPLKWSGVPEETKSFALICDDPDAPMGTWVHWVVYDIPPEVRELQENVPDSETLDNGAVQGETDFRKIGYGGPCPPSGTHRYFFKIYAVDKLLKIGPGATKKKVLDAIKGHVLDSGQLMGRYKRR